MIKKFILIEKAFLYITQLKKYIYKIKCKKLRNKIIYIISNYKKNNLSLFQNLNIKPTALSFYYVKMYGLFVCLYYHRTKTTKLKITFGRKSFLVNLKLKQFSVQFRAKFEQIRSLS